MKNVFSQVPIRRLVLLATLAMGLASTTAQAASRLAGNVFPSASLVISNLATGGSQAYELPTPREGVNQAGDPIWVLDDYFLETSDFQLTLHAAFDPDPSIAYGITVTDFGAPTSFSFGFFTPIVPTGSPNDVSAWVVGELLDDRGDGVSLTPTAPWLQVNDLLVPVTNMGVDVGAAASHPAGPAGAIYPYGAYALGPLPGPGPGPWTGLSVNTSFLLSGGNDRFELTGSAIIVESSGVVPEPGTVLGAGVLCLGIVAGAIRRRRARG